MATIPQGTGGNPVFFFVSTTGDPNDRHLTVKSDCALCYSYATLDGAPLGVSQAPDGISPHIATYVINVPYPAQIVVTVYDSASQDVMGESTLQLNGGDVYQVRVTYNQNIPGARGYFDAMVDGSRQTVFGQDYADMFNTHEDVQTRGSGG